MRNKHPPKLEHFPQNKKHRKLICGIGNMESRDVMRYLELLNVCKVLLNLQGGCGSGRNLSQAMVTPA